MLTTTRWPAVVSVTLGIFSIVTTEILPIGLLTPIGASFGISDGTAGLMMTMPGVLAAVAAPAVASVAGRTDRRVVLCALMAVLALADLLAAVAPGYWLVIVSRVLVGLVIGGFWALGSGLGGRLATPSQAGTATAVIFSAVPLGSVLGVPAGTLLGQLAGWRAVFAVMGLLTVGVVVALAVWLPPLPALSAPRAGGLLGRPGTVRALVATFLIVLAHFGAYTYVRPLLQTVTHAGPGLVTGLLLVYGVAGVAGNFAAGSLVGRRPRGVFAAAAGLVAVATLSLPLLGGSPLGAGVLLVVWGLGYGAVPVCSQTFFALAAPDAPEAATVLFTSSFQATLSAGALLGGVAVDATSPSTVMLFGGAVALLAAASATRHPRAVS
ncbi:MFS transporter [Nonomuraea sp. NPDC050536]|uniref:MFS transporter n=1 Tax=Nonomuraea sp. NPDC050536 TaxID=3364366 RepID=UPI0037C64FD0